ncbi:UPF0193 protein EVG1 [Scleropages formosus]|uniref:Chromosome 22 open reading frame 23 n=1 Tax=Scleropages formosus TaxID=113540 RepID=A0A8C9RWI3_SCLFO|nr:UPF0193 protein EVG1 [Scleropages formosus]
MEMSHKGQAVHTGGAAKGLWSCPRVPQYSKETLETIRLMMQEAKLSHFKQRQIISQLQNGGALRLPCKPTSSATGAHPRASAKQACGTAARPQKRSAEMCRAGDSYTRDKFLPSATRDLEKEKRRLQNIFATGNEKSDTPRSHHVPEERGDEEETDRFQEVLDEIEERKQFLEEMTALGKGKYYQNIITTEISQKVRELEIIDRARCAALKMLVEREQKVEKSSEHS